MPISTLLEWAEPHSTLRFSLLLLTHFKNAMHLDGITVDLPQLPLEIVIERKDNLLKSFDAVFEKTDSLTADINFLWDHHALCKHQVKALVPLPVGITEIKRLDNCPNCLWCKLE